MRRLIVVGDDGRGNGRGGGCEDAEEGVEVRGVPARGFCRRGRGDTEVSAMVDVSPGSIRC